MKEIKKQLTILFAVYDKFINDQRAVETIKSLANIGNVFVVSYSKIDNINNVTCIVSGNGKRKYFAFKRTLRRTYKTIKPNLVFLHDNYCSFFIKWLRKRKENTIIGYDSSELYYDIPRMSINSIKSIIINEQERRYLKYADFVFAANIERAMIMKDVFSLKSVPTVWNNVHRIDDEIDYIECEKKFANLFNDNRNIILYYGGLQKRRGTFDLIHAISQLGDNYRLIIAGSTNPNDYKLYEEMIGNTHNRNYEYIGFLSRSELKYLLSKSKISVSIFDLSCVNHIFCASGKVYEAIFEGVPVLTSTNPPFERLCDEYGVGVSTSDYAEGIKTIMDNYDYYVKNTQKLIKTIDYDNRITQLTTLIKNSIDEIQSRDKNE